VQQKSADKCDSVGKTADPVERNVAIINGQEFPKQESSPAMASFPVLCAEHVRQLGGASPLHILIEEK
jgi:hypothetical protein